MRRPLRLHLLVFYLVFSFLLAMVFRLLFFRTSYAMFVRVLHVEGNTAVLQGMEPTLSPPFSAVFVCDAPPENAIVTINYTVSEGKPVVKYWENGYMIWRVIGIRYQAYEGEG